MTTILYRISIRAYALAIWIASIFSDKARKWVAGRKRGFEELERKLKDAEERTAGWIWVHASSLGEFEQVRPILEGLRKNYPDLGTCLSFFSPSGFEARKDKSDADIVTYMPLDTPANAERFVKLLKPELVLFVKYELWHEHLKALKEQGTPILLLAAVFRPEHRYFKWYGGLFREMLGMFENIHVQDERSKQLLQGIGLRNVECSGDPRYDRVWRIANEAEPMPELERFKGDEFLLIGGSTWPPEEKLIANYMKKAPEGVKLLLAPHEVSEKHIRNIELRFSEHQVLRYSSNPGKEALGKARVLIVDRIGLLARIYRYGDAALVGGGFSGSLHNVLEPAAHGVPTFFGPDVTDFPEAVDLIVHGSGVALTDAESLKAPLQRWMEDRSDHEGVMEKAEAFVESRRGASEMIMKDLEERLFS